MNAAPISNNHSDLYDSDATLPIVVFQMGSVGSSSIVSTLKGSVSEREVKHVHYMNGEALERIARTHTKAQKKIPKHIVTAQFLKKKIDRSNVKKIDIITAVRDPIARNISAFFQNLDVLINKDILLQKTSEEALGYAMELFMERYNHDIPLTWFDNEMAQAFHFDIYSQPFPCSKGYHIIQTEKTNLMIIRLENFNQIGSEALQRFLHSGKITLSNRNSSETKWYSDIYSRFRNTVRFPKEFIDHMYSTKFMKHFYSSDEIDEFTARWQKHG